MTPHIQHSYSITHQIVAGWLLVFVIFSFIAPLLLLAVPASALAQCPDGSCDPGGDVGADGGGLGGLLGGGLGNLLQNPMIMGLLMMLLMQLFQGFGQGGATPQTRSFDEQPSQYANVYRPSQRQPSNTYGGGSQTTPIVTRQPSPTPQPSDSPFAGGGFTDNSFYLVENTIFPTSATITKGQKITVYNTEADARTVTVRLPGQSTGTPQSIPTASAYDFTLSSSTGTFTVCVKSEAVAEVCPATVTVNP